MAGSVNKVILVGNLGRDPEVRRLNNGEQVCNLRLATTETWRDKASGERKERTEWHQVVIFNENLVRVAEQYLKKGSKVYVEGQLQTRKWTDQQGAEKYSTEVVLQRFRDDPDYRARFARAFGPGEAGINFSNLIKAIAVFQRGVVSADSRYDRYLAGKVQLTEAEERGRHLFFSEQAQCSQCHSGPTFSDQYADVTSREVRTPYHNTGLYNVDGKGGYPDGNRGILELSGKDADMGAFRTQSLRNVALTAPYMHDGSVPTLAAVLDHYAAHGRTLADGPHAGDGSRNPHKDPRLDRIQLNAGDKADLIAFLKTLTDETLLTSPRYANPFK